MSAARALGYLVVASFRGRARQLARRLRSPRHFLGMLLGVAWLLFVIATNRQSVGRFLDGAGPYDAAPLVHLLAAPLLALFLLLAWVLLPEGSGLGFTEAEIHVLFAMPLRRRQLVAYKLAQSAVGSAVTAGLTAAIFAPAGAAGRATFGFGVWLTLLTVSLHGAGAALTRAALAQHGLSAVRRRAVTLAVAVAVPAAAVLGWWRAPPLGAFPEGVAGVADWAGALVGTAPLSWVLVLVRAPLDVAFAPTAGAFLAALPAGAAVLALHVGWVFSSDAAFEELALAGAARFAARAAAAASGVIPIARRGGRRRSFALRAEGRPEAALAWKSLVRGTRVLSIPLLATGFAFAILLITAAVATRGEARGAAPVVFAILSVACFAMMLPMAPVVFSGDLRRDAPHLELLRALPLRGRQVLVGEIAAPFLQTVAVQWLLVVVAYACASPLPGARTDHASIALALAVGGPASAAVSFVAANGLVVLYPDWAGKPAGGTAPLDRVGAQSLVGVASTLLAALALVPAVVAGVVVALATWTILGPWAAPAGAIAGAAIVALEIAAALRLLGRAFERVDASA